MEGAIDYRKVYDYVDGGAAVEIRVECYNKSPWITTRLKSIRRRYWCGFFSRIVSLDKWQAMLNRIGIGSSGGGAERRGFRESWLVRSG